MPAEALKVIRTEIAKPICNITGEIKNGQGIPEEWAEGTVLHIYKNKGGPSDTESYRPISRAQIIYKIRAKLIAKRLASIMHLITNQTQYVYKTKLSTPDALVAIESYLAQSTPETHLLTGLTKAFGKVNRTILWTAVYKKALPIGLIANIRRGNHNTKLQPKCNGSYGTLAGNNVGICQGSEISASVFIISR